MPLAVDTTRAIRTPRARRELISAVLDAPATEPELDWLEWKSSFDLRERSRQFEAARQILGFANRDPDRAAMVVEGCAYLLLGVEPQSLCGTLPVDPAALDDALSRFLGRTGPQWNANVEDFDGVTVIVVTVEPPRWGDPIFALENGFEGYRDGAVFVRRQGKTQQANSAEIRLLTRRACVDPARRLAIDLVSWQDVPLRIRPLDLSEGAWKAWLQYEEDQVTRSYEAARRARTQVPRYLRDGQLQLPEPEAFSKELKEYLERATSDFKVRIQMAAIRRNVAKISPAIQNLTDHNYAQVQVRLKFDGPVAAFLSAEDVAAGKDLARRPSYESPSKTWLRTLSTLGGAPVTPHPPGAYINNSESADIRFAAVDVRPRLRHRLEPFHLLVDGGQAGKEIRGSWYATSSSASGLQSGVFTVAVDLTPVGPRELVGPRANPPRASEREGF